MSPSMSVLLLLEIIGHCLTGKTLMALESNRTGPIVDDGSVPSVAI